MRSIQLFDFFCWIYFLNALNFLVCMDQNNQWLILIFFNIQLIILTHPIFTLSISKWLWFLRVTVLFILLYFQHPHFIQVYFIHLHYMEIKYYYLFTYWICHLYQHPFNWKLVINPTEAIFVDFVYPLYQFFD